MDPFGPKALLVATTMATLLAVRALRKRTLTAAGAAAGFVVGFGLVATGLRGMVLFFLYQIGTKATRYRQDAKEKADATVQGSGGRGASQVVAVSVTAVALSLWHAVHYGAERAIDFNGRSATTTTTATTSSVQASHLAAAVLAHHAVTLGDTLASEMGMVASLLSSSSSKLQPHNNKPFLVTQPWRRVPVGTNGGVSVRGTLWSFAGGVMVGALTVAMDVVSGIRPLNLVAMSLYGGLCGLLGSMVDSILGATLQATYYDDETKLVYHHDSQLSSAKLVCGMPILNNEQVNLVSVILTTGMGGWWIAPWFFGLWSSSSPS